MNFHQALRTQNLSATQTAERRDTRARKSFEYRFDREFKEVPGLSLTPQQAGRLFGVPVDVCRRVLGELATQGLLRVRSDGHYLTRRSSV